MMVVVMMTEVVDNDGVDDDDAVGDGEDCNDRNAVDGCNDSDSDLDAVDAVEDLMTVMVTVILLIMVKPVVGIVRQ